MLLELTQRMVETIQSAAKRLPGRHRRAFQAEVAEQYRAGGARRAESILGWGRDAVATGLEESRTGIPHEDRVSERGRSKTEEVHPELVAVIHSLAAPRTQADPKFQAPLAFTRMNILFGTSRETSDFVADALEQWWVARMAAHPHVRRLPIDLDNGSNVASSRTRFMKRMVDFSDRYQLTIELAYHPPYHGKYNPVERCWGILENHRWSVIIEPEPAPTADIP